MFSIIASLDLLQKNLLHGQEIPPVDDSCSLSIVCMALYIPLKKFTVFINLSGRIWLNFV